MPQQLESGRSGLYPSDYMTTQAGEVFFCNGLEKPRRWDGYSSSSETAGIEAPTTACTIAGSGLGSISGTYDAYVRFVDDEGIPSSLSPVSNEITVSGVGQIDYSNVPVSSNPRVVKRQIFRNTDGQKTTYYLDVEINDNVTTTASSTQDDTQLAASMPLPILNPDGSLNANRFVPPPTKPFLASFYDRFFFAGEAVHDIGRVSVSNGGTIVTGVGTIWRGSMNGAWLVIEGVKGAFEIQQVNGPTSLTLKSAYTGPTVSNKRYKIISSPKDEWHRIFYSYALEPESVPATNNAVVQDDGDWITGLMPFQNYLFLLKRNHTYRLSMARSSCPGIVVQFAANRGCVNNRCWAQTAELAFLLDEEGIWLFDGQGSKPISEPIDRLWRDGIIRWEHKDWFFAGIDRRSQVIRWFVSFGEFPLRTAICMHYRRGTFWLERYPVGIGAAVEASISGVRRLVLLGAGEKAWVLEGGGDGLDTGPLSVDSAGPAFLKDADTPATSSHVGLAVAIVSGRGAGQVRRIVSASSGKIVVEEPWSVVPAPGDKYVVGAVPWRWHSKDFFVPYDARSAVQTVRISARGRHSPCSVLVSVQADQARKLLAAPKTPVGTGTSPHGEAVLDVSSIPVNEITFGEPAPFEQLGERSLSFQVRGAQSALIRHLQVMGLHDVRTSG